MDLAPRNLIYKHPTVESYENSFKRKGSCPQKAITLIKLHLNELNLDKDDTRSSLAFNRYVRGLDWNVPILMEYYFIVLRAASDIYTSHAHVSLSTCCLSLRRSLPPFLVGIILVCTGM